MNRSEKALVVLLRVDGVLLLTAVIPAMMPFVWMNTSTGSWESANFPKGRLRATSPVHSRPCMRSTGR